MIVFENEGLIEIDAIKTMGVSVKEEGAIGYFGTGLKYAIGVLLREGCEIKIFRGKQCLEFTKQPMTIRGKEFDIVAMNGQALAFATNIGRNWKPWQAFRELYCNARDEGGKCYSINEAPELSDTKTIIVVSGAAIENAYQERKEIILETIPLFVLPDLEVHAGESNYLYYRGIRAGKLSKKSQYTYNLTSYQTLTEDRTLAYQWMAEKAIAEGITQATWEPFLEVVLCSKEGFFEYNLPFNDAKEIQPSPQFMTMANILKKNGKLQAGSKSLELFNHMADKLSGYESPFVVKLSKVENNILEKAIARLVEIGVEARNYRITIKSRMSEKEDCKMRVTAYDNEIIIPYEIISNGTIETAKALLEGVAIMQGGGKTGTIIPQLAHYIVEGQWMRPSVLDQDQAVF